MTQMIVPGPAPTIVSTSGTSTAVSSGQEDFMTVLAGLATQAPLDAGETEAAVAEALAGLAQLGEGETDDAGDAWLVPALLARFADTAPAADTQEATPAIGDATTSEPVAEEAPATSTGDAPLADEGGESPAQREPGLARGAAVERPASAGEPPAHAAQGRPDGERTIGASNGDRGRGPGGQVEPRGLAVAAAARAEAAARQEAMARATTRPHAAPGAVGTADATPPESAVTLDVAAFEGAPSAGTAETASNGPLRSVGRSWASPSAASIQRVLEAIERLENAPPPRQLTLDLGDHRLRVALEDGQVRLSLLGKDGDEASRFLEQARSELASRGFDMAGDRGNQRGPDQRPEASEPRRVRPAPRSAAPGLRL